jgi:hypothetical protein
LYSFDLEDSADLLTELDRDVVPERSITRPVLESYILPELSIILVLGAVDDPLLLREVAVLPDTLLRVDVPEDLPDTTPRVDMPEYLPERPAVAEDALLAELVL